MATTIGDLIVKFSAKGATELDAELAKLQRQIQAGQKNLKALEASAPKLTAKSTQQEVEWRKKIDVQILLQTARLKTMQKEEDKLLLFKKKQNEELLKQQGRVKGVAEATASLSRLSNQAALGFAASTAAITGLLQAADPVGFADFQAEMQIAAMEMGDIFIPLLREVVDWVRAVGDWFRNLSDDQKDNILAWAKIGLAALGAIMVLGRVGGVFGTIISIGGTLIKVIKGIWAAFMLLGAASPWAAVALGVTAVVGAVYALSKGFDSAASSAASTRASVEDLDDAIDRLRDGVKMSHKEFKETFNEEERRALKAAKTDDERRKIFEKVMKETAPRGGGGGEKVAEEYGEVRRKHEALPPGEERRVAAVRRAEIERDLAKKLADDDIKRMRASGELHKKMHEEEMSEDDVHTKLYGERMKEINKMSAEDFKNAFRAAGVGGSRTAKETLRYEAAKRYAAHPEELPGSKRAGPMGYIARPQLFGVADAMRRAQMAVTGDPRLKVQQAQLERLDKTLKLSEKMAAALEGIRGDTGRMGLR